MKKLVLATHNRHKVEELRSLLNLPDVEIVSLEAFPSVGTLDETASTLEGNALMKAHAVFQHTQLPSLADDTGLEVYYLNKEPGVFSARFAGPTATYADNRKKLLERLLGVPPRRRNARFRCVLAFVASGGVEEVAEGVCPGVITEDERGAEGFGYDPIFQPAGMSRTLAELTMEEKNRISHRGKAAEKMAPILRRYFDRL